MVLILVVGLGSALWQADVAAERERASRTVDEARKQTADASVCDGAVRIG